MTSLTHPPVQRKMSGSAFTKKPMLAARAPPPAPPGPGGRSRRQASPSASMGGVCTPTGSLRAAFDATAATAAHAAAQDSWMGTTLPPPGPSMPPPPPPPLLSGASPSPSMPPPFSAASSLGSLNKKTESPAVTAPLASSSPSVPTRFRVKKKGGGDKTETAAARENRSNHHSNDERIEEEEGPSEKEGKDDDQYDGNGEEEERGEGERLDDGGVEGEEGMERNGRQERKEEGGRRGSEGGQNRRQQMRKDRRSASLQALSTEKSSFRTENLTQQQLILSRGMSRSSNHIARATSEGTGRPSEANASMLSSAPQGDREFIQVFLSSISSFRTCFLFDQAQLQQHFHLSTNKYVSLLSAIRHRVPVRSFPFICA